MASLSPIETWLGMRMYIPLSWLMIFFTELVPPVDYAHVRSLTADNLVGELGTYLYRTLVLGVRQ